MRALFAGLIVLLLLPTASAFSVVSVGGGGEACPWIIINPTNPLDSVIDPTCLPHPPFVWEAVQCLQAFLTTGVLPCVSDA